MKLTFRRFDLQLAHAWAVSSNAATGGKSSYPTVFVELVDDAGGRGLGETAPSSRYQETSETVLAFLSKVNPVRLSFEDVPGSMVYLETVAPGNYAAKCALNVALLDGAAARAGRALHEMWELGFTEGRHVTSYSIGLASPEKIREKVLLAAAYPILKLKVGSTDDRANLAALREVAPEKIVRVDANEAWRTKEEALQNIKWLAADGRIEFVEQPLPAATDLADLRWLRDRSPLPLFADESYRGAEDAARCAEGFHGVNVKLAKTAGLTGAREALQAALRAGLQTMLGCMIESSLLITAAAHLAELTDHLDLDTHLLITNDPYRGVTAEQGMISFANAPRQTGLGVEERR